ncbi:MAG: hypothetical protein K0R44_211 [Thermomicrobiales bacterium]|nr:hypothetical protein [Thermomicrobiales bacterium]
MCFSVRCQPLGRKTIVAGSPSRSSYVLPSGEVKRSARSIASRRFSWPAIHQTWRGLGHPPLRLADVLSLVEKLQQPARRQFPLPLLPPCEKLATLHVEAPVQVGQEVQRLRREDLVEPVVDGTGDLDAHEENLCFRGRRRNRENLDLLGATAERTADPCSTSRALGAPPRRHVGRLVVAGRSSMSYASVRGPRSNLSIFVGVDPHLPELRDHVPQAGAQRLPSSGT